MRRRVFLALAFALSASAFAEEANATDYVFVTVQNNTSKIVRFDVYQANGKFLGTTGAVSSGTYSIPIGGNPKKFVIKPFIWKPKGSKWYGSATGYKFRNPGHSFLVRFYHTNNGTAYNMKLVN